MKSQVLAPLVAALLLCACNREEPAAEPAPVVEKAAAPAAGTGTITPVDIPAGYGYPGDRATFQGWADSWNIDAITASAWDLWAGMTSDSGQVYEGAALPVWETWCGTEEAFAPGGCTTMTRPARAFERPAQIHHMHRLRGLAAADAPADTSVVSFNKFNPAMAGYLAARHAGPGAGGYDYTSAESLATLNAAWPANTPVAARIVEEAPYAAAGANGAPGYSAMETKPVIFLVKSKGLTAIPLWQGPAQSSAPKNAVPESWFTCVLLDPANTAGPDTAPVAATPQQIAAAVPDKSLSCKTYLYAPLSTIYAFRMDADSAAAFNNDGAQGDGGLVAQAGDYGVLAGMHVNTKTLKDWTWQTFWWQPGGDTPNAFPGSKQGMTDKVQGAWRNYAMCTAWNQTKGNASTDMVVCFNPFLETSSGIPAGQTSNCVSCHGVATAGAIASSGGGVNTMSYPLDYAKPIDFDGNPCIAGACFESFTKTDFSWAIPGNARPQTTASAPAKPTAGAAD